MKDLEIKAKKFAEENQYDLEYFDEGGYQGIDEHMFAKLLVRFAEEQIEEALKERKDG